VHIIGLPVTTFGKNGLYAPIQNIGALSPFGSLEENRLYAPIRDWGVKSNLKKKLDLIQRLKLIENISIASMRRPAKFGRNRSNRAGDIKDFSKSKMAAVPPFWM